MQRLPQESQTQTILRDKPLSEMTSADLPASEPGLRKFGPWSQQDFLLARLIDEVASLRYTVAIAGRLEPKPTPPAPTPRPGIDRLVRRQSPAAVTYLKKLRSRESA